MSHSETRTPSSDARGSALVRSQPLSPGAEYEAAREAHIARNRARMAEALAATAALQAVAAPSKKPGAGGQKRARPAAKRGAGGGAGAEAGPEPPLRRSTRARRAPGDDESRRPSAGAGGDDHAEEDGDDEDDYGPSTSIPREERLARLEAAGAAGGGGGGSAGGGTQRPLPRAPRLAEKGGAGRKDLLEQADEVRALSLWRLQTMSLKAVANRVKALSNPTKLKDFAEVLRARAAELAAEAEDDEDEDAAVEYDRLADEAEAKWARLTA